MKLDNIQGAFIGGAIGDALGFPHEMLNKYKGMKGFFPWKMVRSNKYITKHIDIKPGTYSDDTQLMLAVARSINEDGFDKKHFVFELKEWLSYELGGGKATKKAARNINYNNDEFLNFYEGYTKAGGNGTVMRILPHIVSSDNYSQILKNSLEDTLITHGSPVAVLGEVYFSSFLYQLFNGEEPIKAHKQAENKAMDFNLVPHVSNNWLKKCKSTNGEPYEKEEERIKKQLQQKSLLLNSFLELSKTDKDYYTAIGATGMYKGSAINSTLAAVYTLIKHFNESFLETISIPCYMGNADTDTVGLLTGIIKGYCEGIKNIPDELLENIQDKKYILKVAKKLNNKEFNNIKTVDKNGKKLNTIKSRLYQLKKKDVIKTKIFGTGVVTENKFVNNTYHVKVHFDCGQSILLTRTKKQP